MLDRQGKFSEAYRLAKEALEISKQFDKTELSISYNYLGNLCFNLGNLEDAAAHYLIALQLAEETGNVINQMKYSYNLSDVFGDLEDLEKHDGRDAHRQEKKPA